MATIIRPATLADCDGIAAVHVAAWQEAYRGIVPDAVLDRLSVPARAKLWAEIMSANPGQPTFVADHGSDIVGFANGGYRRGDALREDAEVYAIYVLRSAQGQGIGRHLLAALAEQFDRRGLRSVCLWVARDNVRARRFYDRLGGTVVAERVEHMEGCDLAKVAYVWSDVTQLTPPTISP